MNARELGEDGHGVSLDDDADLDALAEGGELEDSADGLFEGAAGLDDEVVARRLGGVEGDADHDVGESDVGVSAGEVWVGEASSVGEHVQAQFGRDVVAVFEQVDERVGGQGGLAAGEAERVRACG